MLGFDPLVKETSTQLQEAIPALVSEPLVSGAKA